MKKQTKKANTNPDTHLHIISKNNVALMHTRDLAFIAKCTKAGFKCIKAAVQSNRIVAA